MPLPLLPDECFSDVLSYLDRTSLYDCLFVNRYYCRFSIPIIWRDPFIAPKSMKFISLTSTLLTCFNEDEMSSLIPCTINFNNNQSPLFGLFGYRKCVSPLCSKTLLKLSLNIITAETVKVISESCSNISFLRIKIYPGQLLYSIIPPICELSSLKTLIIEIGYGVQADPLARILGDHLTFVEHLLLNFILNYHPLNILLIIVKLI